MTTNARKVGTVGDPRIDPVRFDAQEIRVNERVKHRLAKRSFDAAQPLRLPECQSQAGHFQVFGADSSEYGFVLHEGQHLAELGLSDPERLLGIRRGKDDAARTYLENTREHRQFDGAGGPGACTAVSTVCVSGQTVRSFPRAAAPRDGH
jgi:hypothetical protein